MLDFPNLVLSYHNFQETPENMMEILSELTSLSKSGQGISYGPYGAGCFRPDELHEDLKHSILNKST